jgi:membrane protein YqaA with SNARE-associated domain
MGFIHRSLPALNDIFIFLNDTVPMEEKASSVAQSSVFRKVFSALGVLFILATPFIAFKPDSFTQFGYAGIFIFNTISSGLVILPTLAQKFNSIFLVIVSALGNILNTSVNYFVGYSSTNILSKYKSIGKIKQLLQRFGLIAVYILAIVPLPLDVNGLMSGYIGIPYKKYILINFLGKLTIFSLVIFGFFSLFKR